MYICCDKISLCGCNIKHSEMEKHRIIKWLQIFEHGEQEISAQPYLVQHIALINAVSMLQMILIYPSLNLTKFNNTYKTLSFKTPQIRNIKEHFPLVRNGSIHRPE